MKLSFSSLGCPAWTLEQIAANAASMGFDGVELRGISGEHIGPEISPAERRRVRNLFADLGVDIAVLMGYSCFFYPNPDQATSQAIERIDLALDLGCPLQRVFIGTPKEPFDVEEALASTAANLRATARYAEDVGIKIAIETHDAWLTGPLMKRLVEEVNSPNVGVCFDVGNSYHFGHPLEETFAAIKPYVTHVHFKDSLGPGNKDRLPLIGEGEVNLEKAAQLLEASGYSGFYSCEWEKKWHPELAEPEIAFPGYIEYCRNLEKKLATASSGESGS